MPSPLGARGAPPPSSPAARGAPLLHLRPREAPSPSSPSSHGVRCLHLRPRALPRLLRLQPREVPRSFVSGRARCSTVSSPTTGPPARRPPSLWIWCRVLCLCLDLVCMCIAVSICVDLIDNSSSAVVILFNCTFDE
uniref:Uncharacterized protein n=1 Tax=Arundo donax TaxID=35708 RepID=A0A0A9CMU2_ARUDO